MSVVLPVNSPTNKPEIDEWLVAWVNFTLHVTGCQREHARLLARERMSSHDHCRKIHESLGSPDANYRAEFWGCLGEIVVADALERVGRKISYTLLANRAVSKPDITLPNGVTYEVKSSPPDAYYVCINHRQYSTAKVKPDYYLPILFLSEDEAVLADPIPHADIAKIWELRPDGKNVRSPHYSIRRTNLRPLTALDDLPTERSCDQEGES